MKRDPQHLTFLTVLMLFGCATATAIGGCTPFGTKPASALPVALKECDAEGLIDDFEDNNNQINIAGDRGGYWYTYADKEGSTVWPVEGDKGGTFTVVAGGNNSKFAANMKGKLAPAAIVYAAM